MKMIQQVNTKGGDACESTHAIWKGSSLCRWMMDIGHHNYAKPKKSTQAIAIVYQS